ncbi:MAG: branched-chain amino acid ABC transporter permease [Microthrixaceae bacterium]
MTRRALFATVALLVVCPFLWVSSVGAQQEPDPSAAPIAVFGTLQDAGEPVQGTTIIVRVADADEEAVGEATTAADGSFRIEVPSAGTYSAELVTETLPEGVALADPDRSTLDNVVVFAGRDKRVNFALGDPDAGGTTTTSSEDGESSGTGGSSAAQFANLIWSGVKLGLVIAMASIGLSLIFGTTGLVNFAHGELVTMGALITWFFNSTSIGPAWPLAAAAVVGVAFTALFGAGVDRALWRPLSRRVGLVSMMIITIGMGLFLRHVYQVVFEASPRPFAQYGAQSPWSWGVLTFPPKDIWLMGICIVALGATVLALEKTRLGTAVRAVSDNRDLAQSSGIDVNRVVTIVWAGGAGLAGLGGVIFGLSQSVQWDMGFRLLLIMFAAVILGGLGSVYGPIVGGLLIGIVFELSSFWFPVEFKLAWALAVLIIVLLVRPQGLLGRNERIG